MKNGSQERTFWLEPDVQKFKNEHREDYYFGRRNSEKMGRMLAIGIEFYVLEAEQ